MVADDQVMQRPRASATMELFLLSRNIPFSPQTKWLINSQQAVKSSNILGAVKECLIYLVTYRGCMLPYGVSNDIALFPSVGKWKILTAIKSLFIISYTLVGTKIIDHSDVIGALPVGAAPTTSSFFTYHEH